MFLKHHDVKQKNWRMRKVKKVFVSSCMLLTVGLGVAVPTGFSQSNGVMVVKAAEVPAAEGVFKIETDNLQNWEAETNTQGYKGTFSKSPDSQGFYKVQTNSGAGIGVQVAPKGNGRMDIKIGNRVEIPKGYYVGGIRTKTPVLEKDNTYRLSFTTSKTSGTDVEFKTRIKDVEANGDLGQEHTIKFDGNTVSTGNPWIKGLTNKKHTVDFIGKGKALSMAFRFSPFKTTNITYTFTDMNISNVTPASVPETPSSVYEEATKISGKAVASKDNFNKRTNFLGDVVNVYKLDQLVGTAQVKSGNTFEVVLNLKEPLKQGEKLEVEIQNPKSALLSARVPINVIAKPYDKAQHLKDSKASLDEAYRQTVENITQDNWLKSSEKQKQTNAAKLAYDQGIIELGRSNDKAAINSVVTKYTQEKTGLITKEHILGEKDKVITAAKNAIEEKATAEKTKIDSDNSLTTPEKEAQLAQLSTAKEAALTAITESPDADTVGTKQTEGEASVSRIHQGKDLEAIKTAAKNAIEEKATAEKTKINNDITLTAKDKEQQLKEVETALTKAKDNVKAAKTADAINDARDKGVATIDAVHKAGQDLGARKSGQVAKLEEAAKATKDKISADPTLTSKEKEEQSKAVDAELKKAIEAVNAADTADKVDDALGKGVTDIKNQHKTGDSIDARREAHSKELDRVAQETKGAIEKDPTLTTEEKAKQVKNVDAAKERGMAKLNEAKNADELDKAHGDGVTNIKNQHKTGDSIDARREAHSKELDRVAQETKGAIEKDPTLTTEEKAKQVKNVDAAKERGMAKLNEAKNADELDKAYGDGVTNIKNQHKSGDSIDARREAHSKELDRVAQETKGAIEKDPTLTTEEKAKQVKNVDAAKERGMAKLNEAKNADELDKAHGDGVTNIKNQHKSGDSIDARREAHSKELDRVAQETKGAIEKDPTLTTEEKAKQVKNVDAAKERGMAKLNEAKNADELDKAHGDGVTNIKNQHKSGDSIDARREAHSKELDRVAQETKGAIEKDPTLTTEEKAKQVKNVDAAKERGMAKLNEAKNADELDKAHGDGVTNIKNQHKSGDSIDARREAHSKELERVAQETKGAIEKDPTLTTEEKAKQVKNVDAAKERGMAKLNEAKNADALDKAYGDGVTSIKNQHKSGDPIEARRGLHNKSIDEVAQATKDAITADTTLTEAEKEIQRGNVDKEATKAKEELAKAKDADALDKAYGDGVTSIKNQHKSGDPIEARRGLHNKSIDEVAQATKDAITADTTLTEAEKETQRGNVDKEATKAKEELAKAKDADALDKAYGDGVTSIKNQHKSGKGLDVRKDEHKKALEAVAKRVTAEIEADPTLTPEVREQQKAEVQKELELATDKIAEAKDADEADKAYGDGVTAIENAHVIGKGIEARKDLAKKDLAEAAAKTKALIIEDKTLTDDQRKEQLSGVDTEYAKGIENIDAAKDAAGVDKAYSDGVRDILAQYKEGQNLNDRRNAAKEFLLKEADKVTKLINDDPTLTHDQKVDQINKVEQAKLDAIKSVDDAQTADAINDALGKGIENINNQYQHGDGVDVRKATAKGDLEKEAAKVKALIAKDPTLTQADKDKQTAAVDAAKNTAIAAVDKATTAEGINQELGKGITAINKAYRPGEGVKARKEAAKADLEKEAAKVKALIAKDPTLTQADKDKQTAAVDAAKNTAIAAVDKATTAEGINQELGKGITAINKAYRPGEGVKARKEAAKADLEKEAAKVKALIAKDPTLTQADKDKQTAAVDAAKNTAIAAVDKATTAEGINQELGKGITAINKAYRPGEGVKARKEAAKADLEKEAAKVKALIAKDPTLTQADKDKQTAAVDAAKNTAIAAVDKATTAEGINQELGKGITAINKAYRPGEGVKARKEAAKADLEKEAAKVKALIAKDPTLTQADKDKQTAAVDAAKNTAIAAVDKATTAEGINQELGKGITAINKAYRPGEGVKARKEAAKADLEKVAKETKALISGDRYLSETEKAVQKQAVEQALAKALGQVETAKTVEAVKLAENLGTVAIRSAYVAGLAKDTDQATAALNEAKQAAIEALKQAAAETLAKITTDAKLTEAQKAEQSENVSLALKTAIATVRSAQSIASVKEAKAKGIAAIRAAYVPNKAVAKSSSANHLPKSGDANSIVLVGLGVISLLLGMVLYSKKKESKD
ncbi:DUF1542 domain-containing protein [Streptococcus pyogenes]|uniref:LPXTG cell wall anchor domain-containing protein n=6 Tax=Streptococcus pyogenes TaxID=1314 RepID=UPI000C6DEF85|nr:DUF1542 domain-containing protein [Streptococcus pyogenes]AUG50087.1 hypothetical protein CCX85_02925 [Streptococcus pyogenes]